MKRVCVLGSDGMLGNAVTRVLSRESEIQLVATARHPHDDVYKFEIDNNVVKSFSRLVEDITPAYIVNCIGVIRPGKSVDDYRKAFLINARFPQLAAAICSRAHVRLIHISTDCVFRGKDGPYYDTDSPDEENIYGLSKSLGEVRESPHVTIRTSIIGKELRTKRNLLDWFLTEPGPVVKGYSRVMWNGVTTLTLARVLSRIIKDDLLISAGLIQICSEQISKYELLILLRRILQRTIRIEEDASIASDKTLIPSRAQQTYFSDLIPSLERQIFDLKDQYGL